MGEYTYKGKTGPLHAAAVAEARAVESVEKAAERVDALATDRITQAFDRLDYACEQLGHRLLMAEVKVSARLRAVQAALDDFSERAEAQLGACDQFTGDFPEAEYADMTPEEWDGMVADMKERKGLGRAAADLPPWEEQPPANPAGRADDDVFDADTVVVGGGPEGHGDDAADQLAAEEAYAPSAAYAPAVPPDGGPVPAAGTAAPGRKRPGKQKRR